MDFFNGFIGIFPGITHALPQRSHTHDPATRGHNLAINETGTSMEYLDVIGKAAIETRDRIPFTGTFRVARCCQHHTDCRTAIPVNATLVQ